MTVVVADTSPLNYLVLIGQIDLLRSMYRRVAVPDAVRDEMLRAEAPVPVRTWALAPPDWIDVHRAPSVPHHNFSNKLDAGEREALALALWLKAPVLIIDEAVGRAEAQRHGLRVIGTLGILRDAHELGLVDMERALQQLKTTTFRVDANTLERLFRSQ